MNRLLKLLGSLLGLLALAALVVVLTITLRDLRASPQPASQPASSLFQSPIETPTQPPYPPPETPTPPQPGTPTAVPTPPGLRAENIRIEKEVQLTFEGPNSIFPNIAWSPQSDAILVSKPNGRTIEAGTATYLLGDLWLIPLDGTAPRKLVDDANWAEWSKGGQWIAYGSLTGPTTQEVYTMRSDGSSVLKVADADRAPVGWFPNNEIAYVRHGELWVAGPRRENPRAILPTLGLESSRDDTFRLSPTGQHLAYLRQSTLLLIKIGTTQPIEVTNMLISNHGYWPDLEWSRDGRWLVYIERSGSVEQLRVVDTESMRASTVYATEDLHLKRPSWVPGSQVIIFFGYPYGTETFDCCAKVFAIDADGTGLNDLTGDRVPQQYPEISPDGTKIAFFRAGNLWVGFLNTRR